MSYKKRGIPTGSANMTPLGGSSDRAGLPPSKKMRVDSTKPGSFSQPSNAASDSGEYAGKAAEKMFPDVSLVVAAALWRLFLL